MCGKYGLWPYCLLAGSALKLNLSKCIYVTYRTFLNSTYLHHYLQDGIIETVSTVGAGFVAATGLAVGDVASDSVFTAL